MKHYAITGNIGSGKSTVCSIFEILGIPVYYSDARAKNLMVTDRSIIVGLQDLLGEEVYDSNGVLNRKWMAKQIFNNPKKLKSVNLIVHPTVRADYKKWRKKQTTNYTLQESALTFEIGAEKHMDGVIVVHAPEELLISRSMKRSDVKEEEVRARLKRQMPQDLKKEKADYLINNSLGVSLLKQVIKLHTKLNQK